MLLEDLSVFPVTLGVVCVDIKLELNWYKFMFIVS